MAEQFLRRPAVEQLTGLSRSSIYDMMERSEFPKPIRLGGRCVAWVEREILEWQKKQIAKRDVEVA